MRRPQAIIFDLDGTLLDSDRALVNAFVRCGIPGYDHPGTELHEQARKDGKDAVHCEHPFMYLHDVGLTFGESHWLNQNEIGSVNYKRWVKAPVWRDAGQCVANVHASITGTLEHPKVSEEGRAFVAGLLA